ncbi:DUF6241 domain-containing protein [Halalkalibacillus halophilus]|uniref:DUF6241 domain-containing protein n=1 Tax=Halalkalibacillus halophilus TaxID=392827 RepID=UPI000408EFB4|nr:DUF6241 domain-containing protein [Halalkalibacillus halophilus]
MSKILKSSLIILTIVVVGAVSYGGWYGYHVLFGNDAMQEDTEEEDLVANREQAETFESEEDVERYEEEGLNPFGGTTEQDELANRHFQEYIHGMSHQKIHADEKWGFYLITDRRIEWLLNGLDQVDVGENEEEYRDILERWKAGDFSQADVDHNIIWNMQGGTIGKATGVMTKEEEQAYIEEQEGH